MKSFLCATIGVANLDQALRLWIDAFGFELRADRDGADQHLAKLWNIDTNDIARQALVASPGQDVGMLHFVEFKQPDSAVRSTADVFDYCPKNLDLYVVDMPTQIANLRALGYEFRSDDYTEITTHDGIRVREIHMHGHDDINIVLLERDIGGLQFSNMGFAGLGPLITIVPNPEREIEFYAKNLGNGILEEYDLSGPEIEAMIGLPSGAGLQFSILGHPDAPLGRIEVICYRGTNGTDLFPMAKPMHTGILHVCYKTDDLVELEQRLSENGVTAQRFGQLETLPATGEFISFASPAGFRIDAVLCKVRTRTKARLHCR